MVWINEPEGKLGDSFLLKDDGAFLLKDDGNKLLIFENISYSYENEG